MIQVGSNICVRDCLNIIIRFCNDYLISFMAISVKQLLIIAESWTYYFFHCVFNVLDFAVDFLFGVSANSCIKFGPGPSIFL